MLIRKLYTLALITEEDRLLLGWKKRGFGSGKWNGFGGKVEPDESIEDAAHRELLEESSLICKDLRKIGVLMFQFVENPVIMEVHVFAAHGGYEGTPTESDEMKPKWFKINEIPYDEMWDDDRIWFPLLLSNQQFSGHFLMNDRGLVVGHNLKIIPKGGSIEPLLKLSKPESVR